MRYFASVKACPLVKALALVGFMGALLLVWMATSSTTWAQAPRPTLTFTPTATGTPGPTATDTPSPTPTSTPLGLTTTPTPPVQAEAAPGHTGPNLKGRVINLSTDESVSDVMVVFTTGGVSVEVVTDENGEYVFNLGAANGVLNAIPSQGSGLRPVTVDVAVRPRGGVETVVNLGVSPDRSKAPPIIPTVQVSPAWVGVGGNMTVTVIVKNTYPDAISGAMVTNWLPAKLVPVSIHSSTGSPYFSDNLAIVELGRLDAESGALVEIVAQAASGSVAASELRGKVSFFYRENAAAQAQALGSLNGTSPTVLPATGVGLPVIGLFLVAVVIVAGWLRRRINRMMATN
jgi:uncharacterized repeat protein (TIGR01451 family)